MSIVVKFLISLILVLGLVAGRGFAATASCCLGNSASQKAHTCCQQSTSLTQKSPQTAMVLTQKSQCHCQLLPASESTEKSLSLLNDWHISLGELDAYPVFALQLANGKVPIWLYRLFYPDRSKLYLEKHSLLL